MIINSTDLDGHQLHTLLGTVVTPRPVAFISTVGKDGIYNGAPFSAVTPVSFKPPIMCFSAGVKKGGKEKDTTMNVKFSKDFVINIMDSSLMEPVIKTAGNFPGDVDEIKKMGFTSIPGDRVSSPRVAEAQVSLECRLHHQLGFGQGDDSRTVFFGEVLLFHIKDDIWAGKNVDPVKMKPFGRLGVNMYCRATEITKIEYA
ncbi:MAG: flavin reductase family protein [Desulfobacterales bacterium]|nr:flavin reductase family protein [Desulfobacterales bacterium]